VTAVRCSRGHKVGMATTTSVGPYAMARGPNGATRWAGDWHHELLDDDAVLVLDFYCLRCERLHSASTVALRAAVLAGAAKFLIPEPTA
jgi:hypothetical protein